MAPAKPKASYAEYLAALEGSEVKLEFVAGEILAMSGGSLNHATIIANATAALHGALQGSGCRVLSSDARVRWSDDAFGGFADVTVVCGSAETLDDDPDGLLNPVVLVEVLSTTASTWASAASPHRRGLRE